MTDISTRKRDLRTGTPVWLPDGEVAGLPHPLQHGLCVDVAVIGGGVSGALLADAALQAGRSVAVFDRRGLVRGSTPASTALLQFELDQPLTVLSQRIGAERAARAWWRSAGAVQHLFGRIEDLGLRCGLKQRASAYLPGNTLDAAGLRAEAAARERIGLRSTFIEGDALRSLTGIDKPGAIWSTGNGELDPVRLVRGLWHSAVARGAQIFAPVELADLDHGRDHVTLTMSDGVAVRAKHVVLATGYELSRLLKPRGYKVITTWAMATAPQRDRLWGTRCLIWEAADPYLYLRTTVDDRIIVGGEDEEFSDEAKRDRLIPLKMTAIRRKLAELLPGVATEAEFEWTGSFGVSDSSLPGIGPVPGSPRCFAVMGYGGNGITFSTIAAQMFLRMLAGIPDPDSDVFAL